MTDQDATPTSLKDLPNVHTEDCSGTPIKNGAESLDQILISGESPYIDCETVKERQDLVAANGINLIFDKFDYKIHTFQFLRPSSTQVSKSTTKTYTQAQRKLALSDSLKFNSQGYDVFFMVNEGDGIAHKKIARSQASVVSLSKLYLDTDSCPIDKVNTYLTEIGLVPHLRIESSPGRFHLYFFLTEALKSQETIDKWQAISRIMHRLGDVTLHSPTKLGMDATMHDYSKVLRIPGFLYPKKKCFVKLTEDNDLPLYDLDDLYLITKADEYISYNQTTYGTSQPSSVPDLNGTEIIEAGERFNTLQSLSMHLANQTFDDPTKFSLFSTFIQQRLDNSDEVYCTKSGALTDKSLALWKSANDKVHTEIVHNAEVMQERLAHINDPKPDPWHLPDEFYLNAPNGFGDIIRQVLEYSLYPCASLAFGTFITGLSILKSKTHLTPGGSSTALYTLNVAPAGYGKGDPMTLLQNTLIYHGMGKLISNEIRSDRGLYNHLAANDGTGIFIIDEVAPLLRTIQQKDASSHHAYISKALLSLYSAGAMKGISLGKLASSNTKKGEKEIVIDNPMLAVLGYTVPEEFYTLFNAASVAKGLFQRFIPIVTEIIDIPKNIKADKTAIIKSDLIRLPIQAQELDNDGNPVAPIETILRTRIPYSPDALKTFSEFESLYRSKLISTAKDSELCHTSGLYSRIAEQVERIATVLSQDEVNSEALEYAIAFMESRHKATLAIAGDTVLQGEGSRAMEKERLIIHAITRLCSEKESSVVSQRDIYFRVRRNFKDMRDFKQIIDEACENGKLVRALLTKKDSQKSSQGLALGEVI